MGLGGLSTQQIFENVKNFFQHNHSKIIFIQLVSALVRQIKSSSNGELYRWSIHLDNSKEEDTRNVFYIDTVKFNDLTIYMNDVKVNLQLAELQSLLNHVENKIIKHFDF